MLAGVNDQSVEFIIQCGVARKVALEELADVFVTKLGVGEAVAFEHASGVGVDDKDRMFRGVEKNGISGFRADAVDVEKLPTQGRRGCAKHFGQRSLIFLPEEADEGF